MAAMLHLNKVLREDHMYAAFSYFDKDGSGYITQDELQQACEQFGLGDVHLEEIIREVDQDNVNGCCQTPDSFWFLSGNHMDYFRKNDCCIIFDIFWCFSRMGVLITMNLWP